MKKLKNWEIVFTVFAVITGALGVGFLVSTLVLGQNSNSNTFAYSLVSAVTFAVCIIMITGALICHVKLQGIEEAVTSKELIVLPSKTDKDFDLDDLDRYLTFNEPEVHDKNYQCIIEVDTHNCCTCKCRALGIDQDMLPENVEAQEEKINSLGGLVSGTAKDSDLILLRHKRDGVVFVAHEFINWPDKAPVAKAKEQPQSVIEFVNAETETVAQPATPVQMAEEQKYDVVEENMDAVQYVAPVEPQPEPFVYVDQEAPIFLVDVVEEPVIIPEPEEAPAPMARTMPEPEPMAEEAPVILVPEVAEPALPEPEPEPVFVYVDQEAPIFLVDVHEEPVELPAPRPTPNPVAPVVDLSDLDDKPTKQLATLMSKQEGTCFQAHPFVEWPEPEPEPEPQPEPAPAPEPEPAPEQPVIQDIASLDQVEHEKELTVEAEDTFDDQAMVGDDSHIFYETEMVHSVAMTFKKTVITSLLTGKKNVVFVKRPPIRLFNKIYIIDRPTASIIGEATVRLYERGLKKQMWNKYHKNSTISKDNYDSYYESSLLACVLVIKTVSKYSHPIPIANFGIAKVPSTFLYVSAEK